MKLKSILLTLSILSAAYISNAQPAATAAETQVLKALDKANAENKKVLVVFHASWCGWCKKFEASINNKDCAPLFNKSYVITYITVMEGGKAKKNETPGGDKILKQYSNNIETGLPFWAILDNEGAVTKNAIMPKELTKEKKEDTNMGCPTEAEELEYFGQVLQETSALTAGEIEIIKKRFAKNKSN